MKEQTNSINIAMIYVGILIGAGFASGQELFQFFAKFGIYGLIGVALAGLSLSAFGYSLLILSVKNKSLRVEDIVVPFKWKPIKKFMSLCSMLVLFGIIVVMLAGTGAVIYEQLGLKQWIGSSIMMLLVLLTSMAGKRGIVRSFRVVVPVLIIGMLAVIVISLINAEVSNLGYIPMEADNSWILSMMLFISCNITATVYVLVPLGKEIKEKREAFGAALGGGVLGCIGFLAVLSIQLYSVDTVGTEVPFVYMASLISAKAGNLYSVILILGIYTTAVGCLFGLEDKIISTLEIDQQVIILFILTAALIVSDIGFSELVEWIYSFSGYIGFTILISIMINMFKKQI